MGSIDPVEGSTRTDFKAAKLRIDDALTTLRSELKCIHEQDLLLLKQLMHIHRTISILTGQREGRSYSYGSIDTPPYSPMSCSLTESTPFLSYRGSRQPSSVSSISSSSHRILSRGVSAPFPDVFTTMTEEDEDDLDDTDQLSQSMNVTIGSRTSSDRDATFMNHRFPSAGLRRQQFAMSHSNRNQCESLGPLLSSHISEDDGMNSDSKDDCDGHGGLGDNEGHEDNEGHDAGGRYDNQELHNRYGSHGNNNHGDGRDQNKNSTVSPSSSDINNNFGKLSPSECARYEISYSAILKRSSKLWKEVQREQRETGTVDERKMAALRLFL